MTPRFSSTFPRPNFTPSFQTTPPPTPKWHEEMGVTVSTRWFLSYTPPFSHFLYPIMGSSQAAVLQNICSSMGFPQATIPVKENLLQRGVLHWIGCSPCGISISSSTDSPQAAGKNLLWCLDHHLLFLGCFSLFLFPPPPSIWHFLAFRKCIFTEVSTWLVGSALSGDGSMAELAGTGCVWQEAVPDLFPQRPHLQPPHPTTKTFAHIPNTSIN